MSEAPQRFVVCGVGLIGGSFALAQKSACSRRHQATHIIGLGRTRAALEEALAAGVIDEIATDVGAALAEADLVLLAMPVGQTGAVLRSMVPHLSSGTIITDAGSTKSDVIAAARAALGDRIAQFVPGHPIAGGEKSGVAAARAELFHGKRVVLTPLAENSETAIARVEAAWRDCGAHCERLDAETHDAVFAAVSHLPHLLAFALVDELTRRDDAERLFSFAGSGFRDFTRIAASHPEMWRDICIANRRALLSELDAFMAALMRARVLLATADGEGLQALFASARARRGEWAGG